MRKKKIRYATKSPFKREEVTELLSLRIADPRNSHEILVGDAFEFEFYDLILEEPLERDIEAMVRHKAKSAYRQIMAPCVVEHAGLILERFEVESYPGGLTQPMWDALGAEQFVRSVSWAGSRAIARALVGYCDGRKIYTFPGERRGAIADGPRGGRDFYWDTVFCPDGGGNRTYSEIATADGLEAKVDISQSTAAMRRLFQFLLVETNNMFSEF